MAYQALYRQWRPMKFSEMVGQELVVTALRNQVQSGRIAHAYLFCGSRGTGKTSTAKILARAVNCENPQNGDACGACESCRRLQSESSFDLLEYDAASNSKVDDMREILETVQYPPQFGRYKVYIIDEVHMLSANAFNALLKTLEEPPGHMLFVLATTEPHKVPATILSRCQRYDFGRIPAEQIAGRLKEAAEGSGVTATEAALQRIARAAEGGMRDALSILDMCIGYGQTVDEDLVRRVLGASDRSFLFRFAEALANEDPASVLTLIDELMREGREPAVFAREIAGHLRSLLIAKNCPDEFPRLMELTREDAEAYIGQAETMSGTRLMSMIDLFMAVDSQLRFAASPRIALESAALHACLRTGEVDTTALLDRVAELEKKLAELQERLAGGAAVVRVSEAKHAESPKAEGTKEEKKARPVGDKDMLKVWKDAMGILSRTSPGAFGFLSSGRLVDAQAGSFVWEPKDGANPFTAEYLRRPEQKSLIEKALGEASGLECRFSVAERNAAQGPLRTEDGLKEIYETFGAGNVIVQE